MFTVNSIAMVGSSMAMCGSGAGFSTLGDGLADGDAFDARDGDDVAQFGFGDVGTLETGEGKQLGDLCFLQRPIELGDRDFFTGEHLAVKDAGDGEAAEIVAVIEVGDENLQRIRRGRPAVRGIVFRIASNRGRRSVPPPWMSVVAVPVLALV